jgi:hypothetical protein
MRRKSFAAAVLTATVLSGSLAATAANAAQIRTNQQPPPWPSPVSNEQHCATLVNDIYNLDNNVWRLQNTLGLAYGAGNEELARKINREIDEDNAVIEQDLREETDLHCSTLPIDQ